MSYLVADDKKEEDGGVLMQKTVWKRMLVTLRVVTDPASSSANPACITGRVEGVRSEKGEIASLVAAASRYAHMIGPAMAMRKNWSMADGQLVRSGEMLALIMAGSVRVKK